MLALATKPLRFRLQTPLRIGLLLLPLAACAAPAQPNAANAPPAPPPPAYTGTVLALRPESALPDPNGALAQIMTILGEPAPAAVNGTEIIIRLPDNGVRASVQPSASGFTLGGKAAIPDGPSAAIQPD